MAKKQENDRTTYTMEDFLLAQLQEEVILKDGTQLKAHDGHVMTKQEAIATNLINMAMKGDTKAAQYIQNIQMRAKIMKKEIATPKNIYMKQEIIDIAGLSYPDKRDCGVSQRAKTNTNYTNLTNYGKRLERRQRIDIQDDRREQPHRPRKRRR